MEGLVWVGFVAFVAVMLALDLGVFHRRDVAPTIRSAAAWSAVWIGLAVAFAGVVYWLYEQQPPRLTFACAAANGSQAAVDFLTAYVLEKSLSIDNIFVIALIFSYFKIPAARQHRVLFWGILGAVALRAAMIFGGVALLERFAWLEYVLGGLLIFSAVKLAVSRDQEFDPDHNPVVRLVKRLLPVSTDGADEEFFTRTPDGLAATPLLLALVVVETTDVIFAVDSIPAVFAVTRDPFLVFTSNIFAILGLRSLYFVLAGMLDRFRYLQTSLIVILGFVGLKMLTAHVVPISNAASLGVIGSVLAAGMLASRYVGRRSDRERVTGQTAATPEMGSDFAVKYLRRAAVAALGGAIVVLGAILIPLPGPGSLVLTCGLAVLGVEFGWARDWLKSLQNFARSLAGRRNEPSPPEGM